MEVKPGQVSSRKPNSESQTHSERTKDAEAGRQTKEMKLLVMTGHVLEKWKLRAGQTLVSKRQKG